MSEHSQKELDKLFQQGAEHHDFAYRAEAWEQMEKLLDKEKRRRRLLGWLWPLGLLLLAAGAYWFFNINGSPTFFQAKYAPQTEKHSADKSSVVNKTQDIKNAPELKISEDALSKSSIKTSGGDRNTERESQSSEAKKEAGEYHQPGKAATEKTVTIPVTTKSQAGPIKISIPAATASDKQGAPATGLSKSSKTELGIDKSSLNFLPFLPIKMLSIAQPLKPKLPFEHLASESQMAGQKSSFQKKNAWILSALTAGELTSVGADRFSKWNWKAGGHLEFVHREKYGVGMGINYVRKNYLADTAEYIPPKGFWTRGIKPNSAEGACNIIELPVTLGYSPNGFNKSGWFGRIGLVSFILLKEEYKYFYTVPDTDIVREWSTKNDNKHWFGIGQFSLGYQMQTKPKVAFQIEPFIQIPFTGIGHGQVKLWSIGINARMNFRVK